LPFGGLLIHLSWKEKENIVKNLAFKAGILAPPNRTLSRIRTRLQRFRVAIAGTVVLKRRKGRLCGVVRLQFCAREENQGGRLASMELYKHEIKIL
jgi:hypothetical protein